MPTTQKLPPVAADQNGVHTPERQRLPMVVWMLGVVAFVMGTTELIVAGLLPQVAASLDVSIAQAGLLITVFALGMVIGTPVMAVATLRLPRKATLIAALLLFAVAHVVAASTDVFAVVLVARFVAAIATGTFWAIGAVVAAAAAGPEAGAKAMGIMVGGVTLATVLGVPIGTAAGQVLGWQGPFWVLAILAAGCAVLLWKVLPRAENAEPGANLRAEFRRLRSARLWTIYAATALIQASFIGVYSYIAPQLTERAGIAQAIVPIIMIAYGIGALAGTTLGGRFGDRHPYTVIGVTVSGLIVTMAVLLVGGGNPAIATVFFTLMGLFGFAGTPILVSEALRTAGPDGVLPIALSNSFFNVGIAIGSGLGGVALASSFAEQGVPGIGLILAAAAAVPCIVLALTAKKATQSAAALKS
ncbi:MFS transporter [Rathayibacter tanaceti]|uniref:MFS transporter n=2 Tax=Rathayibacter tanaceti TaxID=1671680 RepID=A0A166I610_9MICO|nr:MFS transporter [Rathayibacter tanaceti]KZX21686.1 Purine efflux pump PbuE [Rathayibacter tanaceti]QHC54639.1 MFS transporter [Rathayibacter tanaceti]TCO37559.1 DHA1 family inner membrane transport protein [Rathayibacter tanaceti]